jgi:DNA-3-methyladenine glycosylase II
VKKYFEYGELEVNYLKSIDPKLKMTIEKIGKIERAVETDLFTALASNIVSQQISTKAAVTVWNRLVSLVDEVTPISLNKLSIEEIQKCGMSFRKASYIKEMVIKVVNKELDINSLNELSDDEVIKELVKIKGIGKWTAEMLLIFSMERANILSFDDLAIHRGLRILYGHDNVDKQLFENYCEVYSPYGSVASLYLWKISGNALGSEFIDPKVLKRE